VISGFRRDIKNYICAILGLYAEQSGNSVPTFWENLSVPSSRVKKSKKMHDHGFLMTGPLSWFVLRRHRIRISAKTNACRGFSFTPSRSLLHEIFQVTF